MAGLTILLPYNFTVYDQKARDFVVRAFADQRGVEVTLFNAYTPAPEIEMRGSPIMKKMTDSLAYFAQKIKEQEAELEEARIYLLQKGFEEKRLRTAFVAKRKDIAGEIVDFATAGAFDAVVLNRKPARIIRFFAGSVLTKVLATLKDITVCVVS